MAPSKDGRNWPPPPTEKVESMGTYSAGTLLTCAHDGCGCRVRIENECHCPGADGSYKCACGADLVPVDE